MEEIKYMQTFTIKRVHFRKTHHYRYMAWKTENGKTRIASSAKKKDDLIRKLQEKYEPKEEPKPAEKKANFKKTLHIRVDYKKAGRKGFHPLRADFVFVKVAETRRELELYDQTLEQRGAELFDRLQEAANKDTDLQEFFSHILGSKNTSIVFGTETIEETEEDVKEEVKVDKWAHV